MQIFRILYVILAIGSCGCLAQQSTITRPSSAAVSWSEFVWVPLDLGKTHIDKGAMLLPVKVPDEKAIFYMQLDLGSNVSMFYNLPYSELLAKHQALSRTTFTGQIANTVLHGVPFSNREGGTSLKEQGDIPVIGTIGLDFLEKRVLVIDYAKQRIAILDSEADLTPYFDRKLAFVDAVCRNDKFFVPLRIADKIYENQFFFDTGSSIFPLSTTSELWQSLTERTGDESSNVVLEVPAWGSQIKLIGAPLKGSFEIASASISNPLIFFQPDNEDDFSKWPFPVSGLFGNALFFDRMIVVDVPHHRFGISR